MPTQTIDMPFSRPAMQERQLSQGRELLEKFQATTTKVAVQKDGELTGITRQLLRDHCDIVVPDAPDGRVPVAVSEDGETGFIFARNKNLCKLVAEGAVDMAIVGTDRLIEDGIEDDVDIVADFRDFYTWSLVLATPSASDIQTPNQIAKVATQYPVITRRYFESIGCGEVEIVTTAGETEVYPYLQFGDRPIDAVVDLTVTGKSLEDHDMAVWTPTIGEVYPVLITARTRAENDDEEDRAACRRADILKILL